MSETMSNHLPHLRNNSLKISDLDLNVSPYRCRSFYLIRQTKLYMTVHKNHSYVLLVDVERESEKKSHWRIPDYKRNFVNRHTVLDAQPPIVDSVQ